MLLKKILGITKTYKPKNNQKHKNVKPNPTLHIIWIKVYKNINICIPILWNTSHNNWINTQTDEPCWQTKC